MHGRIDPPVFNAPRVIIWLAGATIGTHLLLFLLPPQLANSIFDLLAFRPLRFTMAENLGLEPVATLLSPLGYTLLHADMMHLFVNMAMLLAFGSAVARRMGEKQFLLLYFGGAIAGAVATSIYTPASQIPVIGASAAVSAMVGAIACLALFPRPGHPPPPPFHRQQTAISFILFWLVANLLFGLIPGEFLNISGRVAWEAHVGGFLLGAALIRRLDFKGMGY